MRRPSSLKTRHCMGLLAFCMMTMCVFQLHIAHHLHDLASSEGGVGNSLWKLDNHNNCTDINSRYLLQSTPQSSFNTQHATVAVFMDHSDSSKLHRLIVSLRRAAGFQGTVLVGLPGAVPTNVDTHLYDLRHYGSTSSKSTKTAPKYEQISKWLQQEVSSEATHILLLMDGANTLFQADPFSVVQDADNKLYFTEELAAHSNPLTEIEQYGFEKRHLSLHESLQCYDAKDFPEQELPVLLPAMALGSRQSILEYLQAMAHELQRSQCDSDRATLNYLYYSGKLSNAEPLAWGILSMSLDRACRKVHHYDESNPFVRQQRQLQMMKHRHWDDKNHIDMILFDWESTGYIVNHNAAKNQIVPMLYNFDQACSRWMQVFLQYHPEFTKATASMGDRSPEYLQDLRQSLQDSIMHHTQHDPHHKRLSRLETNPMKTSYQKATVVEQAAWFPSERICMETCCAKAIAVSMEADDHHLITSVDGVDLATVALYGHKHREYLAFAVSDLNLDIIPCLQPGTVVYADHEGGGVQRFFDFYRPNMTQPYVLITAGSDGDQPLKAKGRGRQILTSDKLLYRWYGINPDYAAGAHHDKFQMMNLGLSASFAQQQLLAARLEANHYQNPFLDKRRWMESVELATAKDTTRLLFVKFGINDHSQHRWAPYNMACNNRTTAPMDEISCSLGSATAKTALRPSDIYDAAEKYLFGLSPRGNGRDCYRTYELLYLGIIPVLEYRAEHAELFRGLPILQLKTWNYSQAELVGIMREYVASKEFQESSFDGWERLFLKYWRFQVLKDTNRLAEIVKDDTGKQYYKTWTYTRYREPYVENFWPPKRPMEEIQDML